MSDDVAIVGIGIHPFGRHDRPGSSRGPSPCGRPWPMPGSSGTTSTSPSAGRPRRVAPTRWSASSASPACPSSTWPTAAPPAARRCSSAYNTIRAGAADVVMAIGFDKHPRGAFDPDPAAYGLGKWYGDTGLMLTTQFFGMKIQRYMHEHGITANTLAKVAAKAFRNGSLNETPGAASRCRKRRSRGRPCWPTHSRSTCSARPARGAWPWCWPRPTRPSSTPTGPCT